MTKFKKTYFTSDTHGFLDELIAELARENIVDDEGKWIAGEDVQLIHLGDTVDRGPKSIETFHYLRDLQAELADGQVIRLIGNHEFAYCGGPQFFGLESHVWQLTEAMVEDGKSGKLQFAYAFMPEDEEQHRLCVHAGLDPEIVAVDSMDIAEKADYINEMGRAFFENVQLSDLNQPSYVMGGIRQPVPALLGGISRSRGGFDMFAGVTWADFYEDLLDKQDLMDYKLIVGHTIQQDGIHLTATGKIYAINVPYGSTQMLIYDHEAHEYSTTELWLGERERAYRERARQRRQEILDEIKARKARQEKAQQVYQETGEWKWGDEIDDDF